MVQAIVVPANLSEPIRLEQLDKRDADAYRRIVGGNLEAVDLTDPAASVYFNEEGKLYELPINHRLTMLLWMHNKLFRGEDVIVGSGLIVGPPDGEGDDQDAPAELVELLFDTAEYRVQARKVDSRSWHTTLDTVPLWTDAYRLALKLGLEWRNVFADVRVVPELPAELLDSWYEIGIATPPLHDAVDPAFSKDNDRPLVGAQHQHHMELEAGKQVSAVADESREVPTQSRQSVVLRNMISNSTESDDTNTDRKGFLAVRGVNKPYVVGAVGIEPTTKWL